MGVDRTRVAAAEEASSTVSRPQAGWSSRSVIGDSVRVKERHSLGTVAAGTRLGFGDDGLATLARLATTRRVGQTAPDAAGPSARSRADRLVTGLDRLQLGPGRTWWKKTGRNPTDRGKLGSKHHLVTDAQGIPLATAVTAANQHDVTQLLPLVDAIPPIPGKQGRPRRRPERIQGDRAYDSEPHRRELRRRKIRPLLARRNTEHGSGLGTKRWPVERTISWLHQFRRLRVRYDRNPKLHQAFLTLGTALVCTYFL